MMQTFLLALLPSQLLRIYSTYAMPIINTAAAELALGRDRIGLLLYFIIVPHSRLNPVLVFWLYGYDK